jgi:hypothetical protein
MRIRYVYLIVVVLVGAIGSPPAWGQGALPPEGLPLDRGSANLRNATPAWMAANGLPLAGAPLTNGQPPAAASAPLSLCPQTPMFMPITDGSHQACGACGESRPARFTPFMLGDFVGPVANQFSDVKIAEGESPAPVDRVFFKFNYYNNLEKSRWTDPTQPIHNVDLYRYTFGFEKALFDQKVSLGLRIPFYTLDAEAKDFRLSTDANGNEIVVPGGPAIDSTHFGNLTAIFKAVLMEDRDTGSLISGGATLSFPTASSKLINPGQSIVAYIQPFGAFLLNRGDFFVQGFLSLTLPLVHPESDVLFIDLGAGYHVYHADARSSWLTDIAPTLEMHIADPLHQPDGTISEFGIFDGVKLHNVVDFTFGSTFEFAGRATLGVGLVVPVTGPKPFDVEALVQLNYRF